MKRDPICTHADEHIGRVSSHEGQPASGEAHASTYVCDRTACIDDAVSWVQELTGRHGQFYRFTGQ